MKRLTSLFLGLLFILSISATAYAADGEAATPSGIPLSQVESFIDQYMSQYIGMTAPGAAVVLVKNGEIVFSKGYGRANIEKATPVDSATTVFEYGSISKLFVYTTIMRLAEQGKLDLDADIRGYLPDNFLTRLTYDEPITMLDIMNHTTGFEDYLFDVILTTSPNRPTMEETIVKAQPLQVYKPGTVAAYSNYAVALAAYIAEGIIGQDFYTYLMETVFEPLKMNATSADPVLADRPELLGSKANGYISSNDGHFTPGGWSYVPLYPIGGINGTAEDLARFAMALMPEDGDVCPLFDNTETLDEMLTQTWQMGPGLTGFAHGFIEFDGEKRAVGHGGNTAYFSTQVNIVPEDRFGIVILTNAANEMDITSGLTEALIGKQNQDVAAMEESLPDSNEVAGTYIAARRMHSAFLELYSYLSPMQVKAVGPNKIELGLAGQTSTLVQTRPYTYERVDAKGAIFQYHFNPVYFQVDGGQVQRMSGDYMPLPAGRTVPWLVLSLLAVAVSAVYFVISCFVLLITFLVQLLRKKKTMPDQIGRTQRLTKYIVLCGTALLINNAGILMRMLGNTYRSFSEFRLQIMANYPLAIIATALTVVSILKWNKSALSRKQKVFSVVTMVITAAFIVTLISWKFFSL